MNIVQEMQTEAAMKSTLRPIYGEETERAFQRIYEQHRKATRETLRVLAQMKRQLA